MDEPEDRDFLLKTYDDELADSARRIEYATNFAQSGLNTLTLINGGAVIALFTLVGGEAKLSFQIGTLWMAFAAFAAGLTANTVAYVCAYLSQNFYYMVSYENADRARAKAFKRVLPECGVRENHRRGELTQNLAIGAAVLALASFISGCAFALNSFAG